MDLGPAWATQQDPVPITLKHPDREQKKETGCQFFHHGSAPTLNTAGTQHRTCTQATRAKVQTATERSAFQQTLPADGAWAPPPLMSHPTALRATHLQTTKLRHKTVPPGAFPMCQAQPEIQSSGHFTVETSHKLGAACPTIVPQQFHLLVATEGTAPPTQNRQLLYQTAGSRSEGQ